MKKKNKNGLSESLHHRIERVNSELVQHRKKKIERSESLGKFKMTRPLRRKETPKIETVKKKLKKLIAYDFETTNIAKGTPRPLYLTAYGADFLFSGEVLGASHTAEILQTRFLTPENNGARFVAWNGNKFDVYFIAMALLKLPDYVIRPYLTGGKSLRGLRVIQRQYENGVESTNAKGTKEIAWEFLDGIAMTGIQKPLKDFLKTFAPEFGKLESPNFDAGEQFNPRNESHRRYAERDSEGLYHALEKARELCVENFSIDLSATIGNMAIKIFQRHVPKMVECWKPPAKALRAIRESVMRGGFCFCVKRYRGTVWKYDINQAYAAAMRDARLPAGRCMWSAKRNPYAVAYIARVTAKNFRNRIPFYHRDITTGKSVFALQEITDTWLTSIEIEQLERERWTVDVAECWYWDNRFSMKDYVNKLERLRTGSGRDPKDAQGELMKSIGNNSYGKTVETLDGMELVMAAEQPEGYSPYPIDDECDDSLNCIWYKFGTPMMREYHQPQIGAFITADVRMRVRRAAIIDPEAFLYADTDAVTFFRPVTLDIDPGRYGAWKVEEAGTEYIIAAKKVYASVDGKTKHAKGMTVRYLTTEDYEKWLAGVPPIQTQIQRQNFVKVLAGYDMFVERVKTGEIIKKKAA